MKDNYYYELLDILEYQVKHGLHVTNIENIEKTVQKLKGKINPIHYMELNGLISQIKLDIKNARINREKSMAYKNEFDLVLQKIKTF